MKDVSLYISGANGFLGSHLVSSLSKEYNVFPIFREADNNTGISISEFLDIKIEGGIFVHAAGLAHSAFSKDQYFKANVDLTLKLAEKCISLGISRFIFISSISVYGRSQCYIDDDSIELPDTPYAESKLAAEVGLQRMFRDNSVSTLVIIRPPMIYGPSAKGSFCALRRMVKRSPIVPFGGIRNRKSFIGVDNLVDFVRSLFTSEIGSGNVLLVSDGQDISTSEFILLIAKNEGHVSRVVSIPRVLSLFSHILSMLGNTSLKDSILDDRVLDISSTCRLTGWNPPFTVAEQLKGIQ